MSAFDFSGVANTTTWTNASFAQDTTTYTQGQVVSTTAGGLHAVCASVGGTGILRAKVTGRTWATTIGSKITLNGIRGQVVTDDSAQCYIVVENGANAWKGYVWRIHNGAQTIGVLNSATDFDINDVPNTSIGATTTADAVAEGDTFELTLNTLTGVLVGKHNGTQIATTTDTTYSTGLTAGFLVISANHGGTGVTRLDTTGDSVGSASKLLSMLANQAGF